jgi:hypothetical protein
MMRIYTGPEPIKSKPILADVRAPNGDIFWKKDPHPVAELKQNAFARLWGTPKLKIHEIILVVLLPWIFAPYAIIKNLIKPANPNGLYGIKTRIPDNEGMRKYIQSTANTYKSFVEKSDLSRQRKNKVLADLDFIIKLSQEPKRKNNGLIKLAQKLYTSNLESAIYALEPYWHIPRKKLESVWEYGEYEAPPTPPPVFTRIAALREKFPEAEFISSNPDSSTNIKRNKPKEPAPLNNRDGSKEPRITLSDYQENSTIAEIITQSKALPESHRSSQLTIMLESKLPKILKDKDKSDISDDTEALLNDAMNDVLAQLNQEIEIFKSEHNNDMAARASAISRTLSARQKHKENL